MKAKGIGDRIAWHVEGTLDETEAGVIVDILESPVPEGEKRYVVRPDNPSTIATIVWARSVVEEAEDA